MSERNSKLLRRFATETGQLNKKTLKVPKSIKRFFARQPASKKNALRRSFARG